MPIDEQEIPLTGTATVSTRMEDLTIMCPETGTDSYVAAYVRKKTVNGISSVERLRTCGDFDMAMLTQLQTITDPVTQQEITMSVAGCATFIRQWAKLLMPPVVV